MAPASSLLIDEWFQAGDERFVAEVLACRDSGKLKSLAPKWAVDRRAFARESLKRYLAEGGADLPAHRPLVKGLFKAAEKAGDDELMGHFLVAFDRFAYRRLVTARRYDWQSKTITVSSELTRVAGLLHRVADPLNLSHSKSMRTGGRFSIVTRRYLQRRAWRYFRKLPEARYVPAITAALRLYPEEALQNVAQLCDAWGLMNALYWGSKVIDRHERGVEVASGQSLEKLEPAPYRPEAWKAFAPLLGLFVDAKSNTVRQWALKVLRRDHLQGRPRVGLEQLRRMFESPREDVQVLAAELLAGVEGLDGLPISDWLKLLELESPTALAAIVPLMKKHVAPERLTLAACIALTQAKVAAVAQLGLDWAKARPVKSDAELDALLPIAQAGVQSVRTAGAAWLKSLLTLNDGPKMAARVRELLDSNHADVRAVALEVMAADPRFGESRLLWAAMIESPWPDVRDALVPHLSQREGAYQAHELKSVWASSLLAIHRGGRAKRAVAAQVADRIVHQPGEAASLLPLLGIALRSVRVPERRTALAQLSRASVRAPALRASIATLLPELTLGSEVFS